MPWDDEKVATVVKLLGEGYSCSQIGGVIGKTRNSVIGKVFRLGLGAERMPKKAGVMAPSQANGARRSRKRKLVPPLVLEMKRLAEKMRADVTSAAVLLTPPSSSGVLGVSFEALDPKGCRFPVNNSKTRDDPHLFCGMPQQVGSSYCPECHARCYTKPFRTGKRFVMRRAA
jgi:GcrA cell cycle regulator